MALHGAELLATAKDNKADLFYEASVAGNSNFTQYRRRTFLDLITKVMGIVNGTTNFILTKMSDEGEHITTC